jgi:transcriptional antiterminator NusG
MTNDLEREELKDIPAEESEAEALPDSKPLDDTSAEQEVETPTTEDPAPEAESSEAPDAVEETEASQEPDAAGEEPAEPELAEGEETDSPGSDAQPATAAVEEEADVSTESEDDQVEEPEEAGAEAAVAETSLAEEEDDRSWYVVHCYSGYENKVRHNLEQRIETMGMKDRIFDVVVPTEEEIEVKDGKRKTIERRVFPGYILVQMIMTEESWYVVRNTPGVTGFVGMGNEPTPLRPEEVSQIIKRMEAEAPRIKVTYKIGQKVRIIDGPFNDFIGTVDEIDMERAKVRVMVSFFGRETPVELDFLQVEKA